MLNNSVHYFGTIRKTIIAFGSLFSNIYIDRKQGDSVTGNTIQRLQIPLAYSNKEKWVHRLEGDPNLENNVYTTLPRMAFEIVGYAYDATRKANKMQKITCASGDTTYSTVQSPVPYNIQINLYILTKTQEDGLQILEQILPTFTPDYTVSINAIPDMNIIQDIPIILQDVAVEDDFEGDFLTRRFVTHTLTFTLKTNLYGSNTNRSIIKQVHANIKDIVNTSSSYANYEAIGDETTGTVTSESWLENF